MGRLQSWMRAGSFWSTLCHVPSSTSDPHHHDSAIPLQLKCACKPPFLGSSSSSLEQREETAMFTISHRLTLLMGRDTTKRETGRTRGSSSAITDILHLCQAWESLRWRSFSGQKSIKKPDFIPCGALLFCYRFLLVYSICKFKGIVWEKFLFLTKELKNFWSNEVILD